MRRNPTLPAIKQVISVSLNKSKQQQTVRKLQSIVHNHDEQILRNDKLISNLANDFRLLKEQLQFQQNYNQKNKSQVAKYQEDITKYLKMIKDQKNTMNKLQKSQKQKDKIIKELQNKNRDEQNKLQEIVKDRLNDIFNLNNKIKSFQMQLEKSNKEIQKLKKDIKIKENDLKQKEAQIKKQFQQQKQNYLLKIKKLQKQQDIIMINQQNTKQVLDKKDKQINKLNNQLAIIEQRIKSSNKNQMKSKNLMQQMKLYTNEFVQWQNKCKQLQLMIQNMENQKKNNQNKLKQNNNQKIKKVEIQKKELKDKLQKVCKQFGIYKVQKNRQYEDILKKQNDLKTEYQDKIKPLQSYYEKSIQFKGQIKQELQKLKGNIVCDFCNKVMKNPVTNIPCGHSYCQQCKNGYLKECKKCSGVKREAVYRNQLLDEIIMATNIIQKISNLFQS